MKKLIVIVLLFTSFVLSQDTGPGQKAPDFSVRNYKGKTVKLSDFAGKNIVLEWVNYGCPFVEKFYLSHKIPNIIYKYRKKSVVWLSVCSSAPGNEGYYPPDELQEILDDLETPPTEYLLDEAASVATLYGIKLTPEVVVIDTSGTIVYRGAIDDRPTTVPYTTRFAKNFLIEVLDSLLAGKKIPYDFKEPYGCGIKR